MKLQSLLRLTSLPCGAASTKCSRKQAFLLSKSSLIW